MSYIDMFIPANGKPLIKPRFVAIEESWELLEHVFPEPGFRSYFLGHVVEKLAEELRKNKITNYHDRQRNPNFASITRLMSNIAFTGEATQPDVRRGIDGVHDKDASSKGDTAGAQVPAVGQGQENQDASSKEKGELGRPAIKCIICNGPILPGQKVVKYYNAMLDTDEYRHAYCQSPLHA